MSPNLPTRERDLYFWRTREQTKRLKYMKPPSLLALRKCGPKNRREFIRRNGDIFALNLCLMSSILAVSILQAVDAGTEMLGIGIEENAKYLWRGDLVLLGCGRCFIYSALAWPLPCDHMICDARYLVMSVIICEVENGTHFTLRPASPTCGPPACSHILNCVYILKSYKLIKAVRCTTFYFSMCARRSTPQ